MRRGWNLSKIGDVCMVVAGQSPKGTSYNDQGNGLPFYQGKKHFGEKFIRKPTTWTTQVTKEAFPGDILMSVRAPVGPINFSNQHICIGRGLAAIRSGEQADRDFLFYFLLSKQAEITGNEGAVFASINKKQIENIEFPLPPLPEQKRIVAILDEAFAGLETAVANTEKNLANARELFESYLNSTFTHIYDDRIEVPLDQFIKFIDYRGKTPKKTEKGLRLITAKNVRMGFLQRKPEEFINPKDYESWMTRGIPKKGDVLFTTEAPLGLVCQLDTDEKVAFAQRIITMQPDRAIIRPEYLAFVLRSLLLQNRIHEKATGATATGIKSKLLKKICIPLFSISKQIEITQKLSSVESMVRELEINAQQKLTAIAELKQSLLQKAFSGELTANIDNAVKEVAA